MRLRAAVWVAAAVTAGFAPALGCKGTDPRGEPSKPEDLAKLAKASTSASTSTMPLVVASTSAAPVATSEPIPISDDEIQAIINPSKATEYAGPTGAIEGTVTVKGDKPAVHVFTHKMPKGCETAPEAYGPAYIAGEHGELSEALVAVIGVAGYVRPSREDKKVVIKDCAMIPRVFDANVGQRILVVNEDRAVYAPRMPGKKYVQRLAIAGQSPVPLFPLAPGAFAIEWLVGTLSGADIPAATMYVLPSALHQVTATDGKFRIGGVPAGKAWVSISHLDMPEFKKEVVVKAGEVVKIDAVLTYSSAKAATSASAAPSTSSSITRPKLR